ncbi:MAG: hypothetical protein A3J48_01050 [Candidatus Doudnabacteria bacterium RIFCSPHIGHO2_02_FULL_46_11]|uniref:Uncharacterized protein n=1 Tax=Candidatus Doudnabacteria bacterium RIFCSPHIGHO2_02_FULL_46_11 TaxID=1817832 RepID=A0A1F5P7K6_9BACT|nr:MAG: hypothetical protein A3J48_01050 [Candidatus Doudnabacteria bacterium RIFCSPHIGHO2_02_FULL_46_11]
MFSQIYSGLLLKEIFKEFLKSLIKAPVVYYTVGLRAIAQKIYRQAGWFERFFGIRLSLHTFFTPLYGDYTRSGRFVGLFIRFFLLVFRGLGFIITLFFLAIIFVLYGIAPIVIIYFLFNPDFLSQLTNFIESQI